MLRPRLVGLTRKHGDLSDPHGRLPLQLVMRLDHLSDRLKHPMGLNSEFGQSVSFIVAKSIRSRECDTVAQKVRPGRTG